MLACCESLETSAERYWAQRLKRVFAIDIETCPDCGGRLRVIACIEEPHGSNESFNGTFRKECLNAEVFGSLTEARVMIEKSRCRYNERRPHSSQNYITPAMAYFGLREGYISAC